MLILQDCALTSLSNLPDWDLYVLDLSQNKYYFCYLESAIPNWWRSSATKILTSLFARATRSRKCSLWRGCLPFKLWLRLIFLKTPSLRPTTTAPGCSRTYPASRSSTTWTRRATLSRNSRSSTKTTRMRTTASSTTGRRRMRRTTTRRVRWRSPKRRRSDCVKIWCLWAAELLFYPTAKPLSTMHSYHSTITSYHYSITQYHT